MPHLPVHDVPATDAQAADTAPADDADEDAATRPGDAGTLVAGLLFAPPPRPAAAPATTGSAAEARTSADPARTAATAAARAAAADRPRDGATEAGPALRAAADAEAHGPAPRADNMPAFLLPTPVAPPPATAPTAAATGADVRVPTPVASPEFAPAIGAQVSLLVRDGVQEARLQLNPAEMGPITVQIQIDGATAQVNFSAEHAFTRERLEQAMPALAGALQDNGLTLTGGGVFEQPRQPQGEAPGGRGRTGTGGTGGPDGAHAAGEALPRPARGTAARGVVDLYA